MEGQVLCAFVVHVQHSKVFLRCTPNKKKGLTFFPVYFNLLSKFRKMDEMCGSIEHLLIFRNLLNKSNNAGSQMLDYILRRKSLVSTDTV